MATEKKISIAMLASAAGALFLSALVSFGLEMEGYSAESFLAAFAIMWLVGFGASVLSARAKRQYGRSNVYKGIEILSVIMMAMWFIFAVLIGSRATGYMASDVLMRILLILIPGLLYFSYYFLSYRFGSCLSRRQSPEADRYGIPL